MKSTASEPGLMSYMYGIGGVSYFCGKTASQKYFFQIVSKKTKTLRLWLSKIQIWIWSEESTQSVDFMGSRSVFGFAPKKKNPVLDLEIRISIFPQKRTHKLHIFFQLWRQHLLFIFNLNS